MKHIFPIIDNAKNNHSNRSHKIKKLKLNTNERLNTFNNLSSYKSLKSKILSQFNNYKSPNIRTIRIYDFNRKFF